ncbi:hypothetical protein BES34_014020 [Leptospira inadai serovar Lyme]|uniref:Lipoprotein n=1 Tax=Leptospira inadai serovar Lyme TaxID=293084 RepID=A0ABX4YGB6_9LEPT|nr:hypothetical protein BES34_014020 [Leptospira inadai serovar Lyme]
MTSLFSFSSQSLKLPWSLYWKSVRFDRGSVSSIAKTFSCYANVGFDISMIPSIFLNSHNFIPLRVISILPVRSSGSLKFRSIL